MKHGHWMFTWKNCDKYEGEWTNDKLTGKGVKTYHDGDKYSG